jgi:hypothetical protein
MEIINQNQTLQITIRPQKHPIKMILCLTLGLLMFFCGLLSLCISTSGNGIVGFFISLIFFYISYGYMDNFFWHIKGAEILLFRDFKVLFYIQSITKTLHKSLETTNIINVKLYDKMMDPEDTAPRSDVYVGRYDGKVIPLYADNKVNRLKHFWSTCENQFFRFGKNLTHEQAQEVVDLIREYIAKPNSAL